MEYKTNSIMEKIGNYTKKVVAYTSISLMLLTGCASLPNINVDWKKPDKTFTRGIDGAYKEVPAQMEIFLRENGLDISDKNVHHFGVWDYNKNGKVGKGDGFAAYDEKGEVIKAIYVDDKKAEKKDTKTESVADAQGNTQNPLTFTLEDNVGMDYSMSTSNSSMPRTDGVLVSTDSSDNGVNYFGKVRGTANKILGPIDLIADAEFSLSPEENSSLMRANFNGGLGYTTDNNWRIWLLGGGNLQNYNETSDGVTSDKSIGGPSVKTGVDWLDEQGRKKARAQFVYSNSTGEMTFSDSTSNIPVLETEKAFLVDVNGSIINKDLKDFDIRGGFTNLNVPDTSNTNVYSLGLSYAPMGWGAVNVDYSYNDGSGILGSSMNGHTISIGLSTNNLIDDIADATSNTITAEKDKKSDKKDENTNQ